MKVTIVKEFQQEQEFDFPDGMSDQEIRDLAANEADGMSCKFVELEWSGTYVTNTTDPENQVEICDW
jgi:hypothetical protein